MLILLKKMSVVCANFKVIHGYKDSEKTNTKKLENTPSHTTDYLALFREGGRIMSSQIPSWAAALMAAAHLWLHYKICRFRGYLSVRGIDNPIGYIVHRIGTFISLMHIRNIVRLLCKLCNKAFTVKAL